MSKLKTNIGYQTIYQLLNTCLPLITAPYLARVLGASQLGIQSYVASISSYFVLFSMLGIMNYGTRSVAEKRTNKSELSKLFFEVFTIQMISSSIMCVLYLGYYAFVCNDNQIITLIQGIAIVACLFDVSWFFFGLEEFQITVKRNIIIRILSVILIIACVKEPGDLWLYTMIMVGGTLTNNIVLLPFLKSRIVFINPKLACIKVHLKPIIILFIPLLALSVFHLMDKTMLGVLSDYEQCGYYYNADKVINIPIGILTGIGTVLLPRITYLISINNNADANDLFVKSLECIAVASSAISFGIASIANDFVPLFFGPGYDDCIDLIVVLAPVLIIKSISLTIRNAYLIPNGEDRCFIISVVLGAGVNLVVNIVLIPILGAMGAVIGTLVAEVTSCIWQIVYIYKRISLKRIIARFFIYCFIGFIMYLAVRGISSLLFLGLLAKILLEIITGVIVYIAGLVIYWKVTNSRLLLDLVSARKKSKFQT